MLYFYFAVLSQWSSWSVCNVRCEARTRTRTCQGQNCNKETLKESKPCVTSPCSYPPSIYIQLRSGAVCFNWPKLKLTSHNLITKQGNSAPVIRPKALVSCHFILTIMFILVLSPTNEVLL